MFLSSLKSHLVILMTVEILQVSFNVEAVVNSGLRRQLCTGRTASWNAVAHIKVIFSCQRKGKTSRRPWRAAPVLSHIFVT
jgi:hypothetical protein